MASVELVQVAKRYGKQSVLHPLDLTIPDGSFTVLVGPSGCGKSTLLRLLAGLDTVSDGAIMLDKKQINDLDPADRDIAMVFQSYALYPHLTVAENLAFHMQVKKVKREEQKSKIARIAGILGIDQLLQRYPRALSGGQRQRVAMGRAIVREPAVFLFDEPLSNLDARLRVQMRLELQQLHRRLQTTSLYVTHDQVEAMTLAQRVMVMNKGVVEQLGTPVEVYERPASQFVASFIGAPAMNLLKGQFSSDGSRFDLDASHALPLSDTKAKWANRPVVLGIRPEHIRLSSREQGGVPLRVDTLEMLGADNLAHGRIGDTPLVVRLAHSERPQPGSTLWLHLPSDALHFFDSTHGKRLE